MMVCDTGTFVPGPSTPFFSLLLFLLVFFTIGPLFTVFGSIDLSMLVHSCLCFDLK